MFALRGCGVYCIYSPLFVTWNQNTFTTDSIRVSLTAPFFVPTATDRPLDGGAAETPFVYGLSHDCSVSRYTSLVTASLMNFVSTVSLSRLNQPKTLSSSPPVRSTLPSPRIAPATGTARPSATSHAPQSPSADSTGTKRLVIGLAIATVFPVLLITIGLPSFCIVRRRRRWRKDEIAHSPTDVRKDEGGDSQ